MQITQTLRRAVQISGERTASQFGNRRFSWREFEMRVSRFASALKYLGVKKEERVAILALNSDRYLEYLYAVAWAGAASNPVNIRLAPQEIAYSLNDSESRILLVDDSFAGLIPTISPFLRTVEHVIFIGETSVPDDCLDYENLIQQCQPVEDAEAGGDHLAGLFYTGGTTGKSKGVMLTHDNLVFNAINVVAEMGYSQSSTYLHAAPMFHLADMASTFAVTLAGGTHCAVPKFDVDDVLKAIQKFRISHTLLVPTMVNLLVSSNNLKKYDIGSLKRLLYGASPMPEVVLERVMQLLPGVCLTQGYGQTEASPIIATLSPQDHIPGGSKLKSAGRAAIGVEVTIRDAHSVVMKNGVVGEICARGPNVMLGYWGMDAKSNEALRGGWLHTGDLGYIDDDGYLFIVDRAKDMVISGGENVFSVEVEGAIYTHEAVQECAVIGVPDDFWGERVHAVVVPKNGFELCEDEIVEHCKARIAGYKVPRSVTIQTDALPVSGAGKILKAELRKLYWIERSKNVN